MKELKIRYNQLLGSYLRGNESLAEASGDKNKEAEIMSKLEPIQKEMEEILSKIGEGNYTSEETLKGFEISEEVEQKEDENKPTVVENNGGNIEVIKPNEFNMFSEENLKRARFLAQSTIIPKTYQENPQNILIAMAKAYRHQLSIDTVMNNLYMVNGSPVWKGSFYKTLIALTGKYKNLKPVYTGEKDKDTYGCYIEATETETGEIVQGEEVTIALAKAEGWYGKTGSKWKTMPKIMMTGRAYSFFAKIYTPEVLDGILTDDEIYDISGNVVGGHTEKRQIQDVLD